MPALWMRVYVHRDVVGAGIAVGAVGAGIGFGEHGLVTGMSTATSGLYFDEELLLSNPSSSEYNRVHDDGRV